MRRWLFPCFVGLALALSGCGKSPPQVTEAEGVVLLNGHPLPNALVTFAPELDNFGAEMNSTAVTDEEGRFKLQCAYKGGQPGAAVGKHRVTVTEAPPSGEYRGMSERAQTGYAEYLSKQKNRPIPKQYAALGTTPLEVEVKPGEKIEIKLSR